MTAVAPEEGTLPDGQAPTGQPVTLALINDYDVVVAGLRDMLADCGNRFSVVEMDVRETPEEPVDLVLYDTFVEADRHNLRRLVESNLVGRTVVYSWHDGEGQVEQALNAGACGYLSKRLTAGELCAALEQIHHGEQVTSGPEPTQISGEPTTNTASNPSGDWPGRREGLTSREAEMIALICSGRSNQQIASHCYLSLNTVKTYIRSAYAKIGAHSRSQAVLWGVAHGLQPKS